MAITYTNFIGDVINPALYSLIKDEFGSDVPVRIHPHFEPSELSRKNRYIRFYFTNDNFDSTNSDGETRAYTYRVQFYVDEHRLNRQGVFEDVLTEYMERLTKLLSQNKSYQPSGAYKWHDLRIESRAILPLSELQEVDEAHAYVWVVDMEVILNRTNQW